MSRDALELQLRELRDQILTANREIEELKKQLDETAKENADLLKEKNNLQEQVDYLKKNSLERPARSVPSRSKDNSAFCSTRQRSFTIS